MEQGHDLTKLDAVGASVEFQVVQQIAAAMWLLESDVRLS
jgi:hypothetical protein